MVYFFQNLINALQWGSFYALIALGYSMVYSIMMLFNFAHGDIFMVGAYIGFGVAMGLMALASLCSFALPGWLVLVLTILLSMFLTSFLGMFVERVGYRPLREAPRASAAITGLMIGIILEMLILWGMGTQRVAFPPLIETVTYNVNGVFITNKKIMIVAVSLSFMLALHLFIKRTLGNGHARHGFRFCGRALDGCIDQPYCSHDFCHRVSSGRGGRYSFRSCLSGTRSVHGNYIWLEGLCGSDSGRKRFDYGGDTGRIFTRVY